MHALRTPLLLLTLLVSTLPIGPDAARAEDAPPAPGKPSPPANDVAVPVGIPVQIDGVALPAEWADATQRPLGTLGGVLRLKQYRGTLLLAVETHRPWVAGDRLTLFFAPDEPDAGARRAGATRLDFEPSSHNRSHLLPLRMEATGRESLAPAEAVARAALRGPRPGVEMAIRLPWLGVAAEDPKPLRFTLLHIRGGAQGTDTWPPGLDLTSAEAGRPPPGLERATAWGRLTGWQDANGPGALSATDWDALVQADEEIRKRGMDAHAFARALAEGGEIPKVDARQQPTLEGNLRWIAEREPLTADDLLALSRGYRFFNRQAEALAVLAGLDADPAWHGSARLAYERALTLESAERFADAARTWEALAARSGHASGDRYRRMAERAEVRQEEWSSEQAARREDDADPDLPLVLLRTTRGNVVLVLHAKDVPDQVAHFLALVARPEGEGGFYDGTLFHRVIGDFVVQGGDPASRESCEAAGSGDGPIIVPPEQNLRHRFYRGAVGFALGGARMNGSQFFVLVSPKPHLEQQGFTCFGHVLSGMEALDRIEQCDELIEARILRRGRPAPAERGADEGEDGEEGE